MSSKRLQYLSKLMEEIDIQNIRDVQLVFGYSIAKIQSQLNQGSLQIITKLSPQEQLRILRQQKMKREMQFLNKQISKNDDLYKQMKKQQIRQKRKEQELQKSIEKQKQKVISEKIKKWSQLQNEISHKKQQQVKQRLRKFQQQDQRKKILKERKVEIQKESRKKNIQKNLKEIEQRKLNRQVIQKNSQAILQQLKPKYLQIQKRYKQYQDEVSFQERILKKNRQLSLKIDHQGIKAHQKKYLQEVQDRKTTKTTNNQAQNDKLLTQKGFVRFVSRDQAKFMQEKQKMKRRKQFQEKVKEIPIKIDQSKKTQIEIQIDKGKNRLKYNFLGQKALTQFQIYGEFNNFQINVNPKQIGDQYLKELPTLIEKSRMTKSNSMSTMRKTNVQQKVHYRDYLQELKTKRQLQGQKSQQQIKSFLKNHKNRQKAAQQLSQRSKKYDLQARKKSEEIQKLTGIKSVIKKQKQVDEMYLKSIKAKLASLQMNY